MKCLIYRYIDIYMDSNEYHYLYLKNQHLKSFSNLLIKGNIVREQTCNNVFTQFIIFYINHHWQLNFNAKPNEFKKVE